MTDQPSWKLIAQLGDKNPIDHGGRFVYVDETGVYEPELEFLEPTDGTWVISRLVLERCTYRDGVLSENEFYPRLPAWFADKLESVAETTGTGVEKLIEQLCSEQPIARAHAYCDLVSYFGVFEFDQYPSTFTNRADVEKLYMDAKE